VEFALKMEPIIERARQCGITKLKELADALNFRGCRTPNGKEFRRQTVQTLLKTLQRQDFGNSKT
jgi:hypothetical protein